MTMEKEPKGVLHALLGLVRRGKTEEVEDWRAKRESSITEEMAYLERSGALAAFKEAAEILERKGWPDVRLMVIEPSPKNYEFDINSPVDVELRWNYRSCYCRDGKPVWDCNFIRVNVARGEGKQITGLELTNTKGIVVLNQEEFTAKLLAAIQDPHIRLDVEPLK